MPFFVDLPATEIATAQVRLVPETCAEYAEKLQAQVFQEKPCVVTYKSQDRSVYLDRASGQLIPRPKPRTSKPKALLPLALASNKPVKEQVEPRPRRSDGTIYPSPCRRMIVNGIEVLVCGFTPSLTFSLFLT